MDGGMDERMGGWVDEGMNRRTDEWTGECMSVSVDRYMYEYTRGWKEGGEGERRKEGGASGKEPTCQCRRRETHV